MVIGRRSYGGVEELETQKSRSRGTEGGQLFYFVRVSHRQELQPCEEMIISWQFSSGSLLRNTTFN